MPCKLVSRSLSLSRRSPARSQRQVRDESRHLRAGEHQRQWPGSREPIATVAEFAEQQGWKIYREFIDHETGSVDDGAEFQSMFQDASQRRFDALLFWALDRLSREGILETLQHFKRLTSYGVGYRSFTEQYFDSCGIFKDAVIAIIATVAKQGRVRISEPVRAGLETARAKGKRLGRPRKIVDAAQVARLRSQGASWRPISRQLGVRIGTAHAAMR